MAIPIKPSWFNIWVFRLEGVDVGISGNQPHRSSRDLEGGTIPYMRTKWLVCIEYSRIWALSSVITSRKRNTLAFPGCQTALSRRGDDLGDSGATPRSLRRTVNSMSCRSCIFFLHSNRIWCVYTRSSIVLLYFCILSSSEYINTPKFLTARSYWINADWITNLPSACRTVAETSSLNRIRESTWVAVYG